MRDVDVASLRSAIAVVDDAPFLFSATVAENIAYARPEATPEEIETAARRAQAHDFIERLPEGYATRVGERGLTLSGGQRQRIAIARAFLADPRILILDDATSSVDATTEREIKDALQDVMAGRTTFVIAHRLSTISLADRIVVLEDGTVAAEGTHDELLDLSDLYREIVEKGLPGPGVPDPGAGGAGGGGPVSPQPHPGEPVPDRGGTEAAREASRRDELRRRLRGTGGRGRKLRGLAVLLRPYRGRVLLMGAALLAGTAASLAPAPLAKAAIDGGILKGDRATLDLVVVAFLVSAARRVGDRLRPDVPGQLGRPAGARRPARRRSSATCRRCRSRSTSAVRRAC